MAEQVKGQRDYEKAIKFYKEALVYNENDSKVMTPIAVKFYSVIHCVLYTSNQKQWSVWLIFLCTLHRLCWIWLGCT